GVRPVQELSAQGGSISCVRSSRIVLLQYARAGELCKWRGAKQSPTRKRGSRLYPRLRVGLRQTKHGGGPHVPTADVRVAGPRPAPSPPVPGGGSGRREGREESGG